MAAATKSKAPHHGFTPLVGESKGRPVEYRVDKEKGIVYGARLHASTSANKRRYSDAAMQQLVVLYEGRPIKSRHATDDYRDTIAVAHNARRIGDVIYGDLHVNPKNGFYEQFLHDAATEPQILGISHEVAHVDAKTRRDPDGWLVFEEITGVLRLALTDNPATGGHIAESVEVEEAHMELDELKAKHPTLVKAIEDAALKTYLESHGDPDKLKADLTEALERVRVFEESAKAAQRRAAINEKITKAGKAAKPELVERMIGLDDESVDLFIESLVSAAPPEPKPPVENPPPAANPKPQLTAPWLKHRATVPYSQREPAGK